MIQFINGINLLIPDSGYLKSGNIKLEDNTISSTTGDLLLSASSNVKIGENRVATVADLNSATGSLGTMSSQNSNNVSITGGTITGITDLAVADGGTGASTAETARSNLGLTIGTNVQAYDDTLNALANVNVSSNQLIYATGSDTFSTTSLTSFGRSLIDDADASTARGTLGLIIGTNVQAQDATLQALAGLSTSADQLIYATGSDTFSTSNLTSFGRSLIDDADASTARTTLGLGTIATQNSSSVSVTDMIVSGDLTVQGNTTTLNTETLTVEDKNIVIAKNSANDAAADGGGITLESGDGDKTFNWVNVTDAWTSSEHLDLASGKNYQINGNLVLSSSALGSNVTISSLTQVGTITSGTWEATDVAVAHGGTGASTAEGARNNLGLIIGTNVQAYDDTLNALANVNVSSNQLIYATGSDTFSTTSLTSFGRSLIDDADASTARGTLGLIIGTNVQAQDATLQALAGLTTSANQLIYATGSDAFSMTSLTSFGRSLIDDADASAARSTLGLVVGTNVQAHDDTLDALAGLTTSADQLIYATGSDTFSTSNLTSFGRSLIDDADASAARTTLGLGTIATQNHSSVDINGGTIDGVSIGNNSVATIVKVDNVTIDGNSVSSSNTNGVLIISPNGTGALQADSTGNSRGQYAIDLQRSRSSNDQVASGNYSIIGGGRNNKASGTESTVGGGNVNIASGFFSTVGGGYFNTGSGLYSAVGGGRDNTASGVGSFAVGGGYYNALEYQYEINIASGNHSTVTGGSGNEAKSQHATVGGGRRNTALSGDFNTVGGGRYNTTIGSDSTVGGGSGNAAIDIRSTVGGGGQNIASANDSTVGGGRFNTTGGDASSVGGGYKNTATVYTSTVGGGRLNTASGTSSTVAGGIFNAASGNYSTVGGGSSNKATGTESTVGGGNSNTASGNYSTVGGGGVNTASGNYSIVGGGRLNTASGSYSIAKGLYASSNMYGQEAHASGRFAAAGDAQKSSYILRTATTNATATVLTLNGSAVSGTTNVLLIPAKSVWNFNIKIAAYNDTNNEGASFTIRGAIQRNNSNATSLIGSLIEEEWKSTSLSTASVSVTANDTNETLEIKVTGVASKNIRWVASVETSEVKY